MSNVTPKLTLSSNHKELGYSESLILESIQTLCELNANFEEVINCKSINISFVSQQEIKELNRRFLNQNAISGTTKFTKIKLYDIRHSYARRLIKLNVPTATAAKCMGNGEGIFTDTYLKAMDKRDMAYIQKNI